MGLGLVFGLIGYTLRRLAPTAPVTVVKADENLLARA